jgi:hypothetical protein
MQPVRSAYQPLASSTFLSKQTSHQQPASSTFLSQQISTSHQPNEQADDALLSMISSFPLTFHFQKKSKKKWTGSEKESNAASSFLCLASSSSSCRSPIQCQWLQTPTTHATAAGRRLTTACVTAAQHYFLHFGSRRLDRER